MNDVLVVDVRYVKLDLVDADCPVWVVLKHNWKNGADTAHASAFVVSNVAIIADNNSLSLSLSD